MDSISPGPLFRWTSIAAPITWLLRRSAFSYNGCISERILTEDSEGNKGWNWVCNLFGTSASFCWILRLSRGNSYRRQRRKQRLELGLQSLRYLRFLLLDSPPFQREFLQKTAK